MASALVLATPVAAMASWQHCNATNVGMKIKLNDTFKMTKNAKDEVDYDGTIYKHPCSVVMGKDDSMDWSKLTDKQIEAALVKGFSEKLHGFSINNDDKGGIGDAQGRYIAFDANEQGQKLEGYLVFSVVEGDLYSVMMFYTPGGDKLEKVASDMISSADFIDSDN